MKKFLSMILSLSLIFSLSVPAFAAENNTSVQNALTESIDTLTDTSVAAQTKSAGLAWGPVKIGNIEMKIVNPHVGAVGPYGNVNHINFHIKNTDTGKDIANYHIFKATSNGKECLIVWDSVTSKTVFRNCSGNWTSQVQAFLEVVKSALSAVMDQANLLATIAILGTLVVVIADLIIPLDPVPILPFTTPNTEAAA